MAEVNKMTIAARPATLTPSTVEVRLCHGTCGACRWAPPSWSGLFTATDRSRGRGTVAQSAKLVNHLVGEERDVIQVRHVEKLQVDPLDAGLDEGAQLVDDLGRSSHHG